MAGSLLFKYCWNLGPQLNAHVDSGLIRSLHVLCCAVLAGIWVQCWFELLAASFRAHAWPIRVLRRYQFRPLPLDLPLRPLGRGGPCSAQGRRPGRNLALALRRGGPAGTSLVAVLHWLPEACILRWGKEGPRLLLVLHPLSACFNRRRRIAAWASLSCEFLAVVCLLLLFFSFSSIIHPSSRLLVFFCPHSFYPL